MHRLPLLGLLLAIVLAVAAPYPAASQTTVTFDTLSPGTIVKDQFKSLGITFQSINFNPTNYTYTLAYDGVVAVEHWPVSGTLSIETTTTGLFQGVPFPAYPALLMEFYDPATLQPGFTDFLSLVLDTSPGDTPGNETVTLYAFSESGVLIDSDVIFDEPTNGVLTVSGAGIRRAIAHLDQTGSPIFDIETYDNVTFTSPVPEPSTYALLALSIAAIALRFRQKSRG